MFKPERFIFSLRKKRTRKETLINQHDISFWNDADFDSLEREIDIKEALRSNKTRSGLE